MVAHRLVEIHRIEQGRIEAGEQLLGNDQNLRLPVEFTEALADLPLLLRIEMELLEQRLLSNLAIRSFLLAGTLTADRRICP
jgi:hypothetical protein